VEVIVGHAQTDFDAFASMLACRRLYPGAVVALSGSLNRNVREFYRLHADELDLVEAARIDQEAVTRLIVVDATDPSRLAELEPVARRPDVEVVWFDHHPEAGSPEGVVRSEDGALTTTLVGILAEREIAVTPLEATVLALGIHEDTGSLTHATTTERDVEALAWCLRHGARQEAIGSYLHAPLGEEERAVLDALLSSCSTHRAGGLDVLIAAVSWPSFVDGVSNLAHKLVDLTDCRALVCLAEMDRRVVCVVRSRTPAFDAATVAVRLGGGGHRQAASATFHGSLAEARRLALAALDEAVVPAVTAGEIMSTPPRFVAPDDTVAHAMAVCQRHRQSGIEVGDARDLTGVVTREDLDKAVGHGLSHAPVKAVASPAAATCDEATPLAELQRLLTVSAVGRVPVVRDGEVVGVVTRGDVLRALGELPERGAIAGRPTELRDRLLALDGLQDVFEAIQAVSGPFDGVYLVGGTVRDILLGERGFDLDIAVEGDGIALGRALARALHGRVVPHEKFGTAVVKSPAGRVDVATTRTEFYDEPAALPAVEQASIRQDLYRRDFTINAMAVSLKGDDFGRLVDYFGGRADLERGVVRVLHSLSFIDDPTRIFRAIRYENRYGFRMDAHTLSLARACIDMGLVGELSSARMRDELVLLLSERDVADAILRLDEIGLAASIHPHLAADAETAGLIERVDAVHDRVAPGEERWRLRLAVLARRLPAEELFDWFLALRLRRRDAERIADAVALSSRLAAQLETVTEAAEAQRLIAPHDPEGAILALAAAPASGKAADWLERYFEELRNVELEISGGDLAALGLSESPRVGEVLDELLRRKLNGELDGRGAELDAARKLIGV
jgi:tRNA nucleotidyltransferase (CCA-adding enzyme)